MKPTSAAALLLSSLGAVAVAQTATSSGTSPTGTSTADLNIPKCGLDSCLVSALAASSCSISDANCVCNSSPFLSALGGCVPQRCELEDTRKVYEIANNLCKDFSGYPLDLPEEEEETKTSSTASAKPSATASTSASASASAVAQGNAAGMIRPETFVVVMMGAAVGAIALL